MRTQSLLASFILTVLTIFTAGTAVAGERQDARLLTATKVLKESLEMPEQNIPTWLLERAYAVAVVPSVIKVGLGIGGRRGKGVLVVRRDNGSWSNPVFVNLTGGSFGFQVGVQATDVVLVFTSRQGIEGIVGGKITLGADAAVAAGPVGRQSSAATDIGLTAQVYSYSRASGLFAGVALDGSALTIDNRSNESFYGRAGILASEIIRAEPTASVPAQNFVAAIAHSANPHSGANATAATQAPAAGVPVTTESTSSDTVTTPLPAADDQLTTHPMEDAHPGAEPPQ